jgi:hypothetical protein
MIKIALAEGNPTYCLALKTLLEQVEGFEVVLLPPTDLWPDTLNRVPFDLLLVDEDLYEPGNTGPGRRGTRWPDKKTIILTMDCKGMATLTRNVESICKGAGKQEFVERIMNLTLLSAGTQDGMRDGMSQG